MEINKQIANEITNLEKELEIIILLNKKNKIRMLDEIEIRGASLSLAALYNGMERILNDILKKQFKVSTDNQSWHKQVLEESLAYNIISKEIFRDLKGFLAFRHFVRHAYSFEIKPQTIEMIVKKAPDLVNQFISEIKIFVE